MTLAELCFHLRRRRRMYLPDDRFASAVAFVEGYNAASDGAALNGFNTYVSERLVGGDSPVHWSYRIASTRAPDVRLDQLPAELDGELTDMMVDLLEEFSASGRPAEA